MRNRVIASIATVLVLLVANRSFAQTQPTTAPALSPQQEQVVERMKLEADNATLPRREVKSISDVLRFSRQQARLVAKNQLEDLKQETRLVVPDLPGLIKIRPFVLNEATDHEES